VKSPGAFNLISLAGAVAARRASQGRPAEGYVLLREALRTLPAAERGSEAAGEAALDTYCRRYGLTPDLLASRKPGA
jgi:hypothetical protein